MLLVMMTRRRLFVHIALSLSLSLSLGLNAPALASGGGEKTAVDPNVRITQLGVPVIANGKVVNYIFMNIKIVLTPKADSVKLQEKEPFFRDALIRTAHRSALLVTGRTDQIDVAKFKNVMIPEFTKITGAGMIKDIEIISQMPKIRQK
jgi:hypothetical protein